MTSTFISDVTSSKFDSLLEIPTSGDPNHNAMLTVTLRYKLNFADGKNPVAGVIVKRDQIFKAQDADGFAHPVLDWDRKAIEDFSRAFQRGERIWNLKFLLVTPNSYSGLDFSNPRAGYRTRPNVLCLLRMEPWGAPHITINVVRVDTANDPVSFRSHIRLMDHLAPWRSTLGHEIGHALGMLHIKTLLGDKQCIADENRGIYPERCYGETEAEVANVMGGGNRLSVVNALPWLERIALHTSTQRQLWTASRDLKLAPASITVAQSLLNLPRF